MVENKTEQNMRYSYKVITVLLCSTGVLIMVLFSAVANMKEEYVNIIKKDQYLNVETACFNGKVTTEDFKKPLKGGIINISYKKAIIDKNGEFLISTIKPDNYLLSILFDDRIVCTREINLVEGINERDIQVKKIIPSLMERKIPFNTPKYEKYKPISVKVYWQGNPEYKRVAITIDDGWVEDNKLLDLFESNGIKCTVFIIGGRGIGNKRPHWIKRMDRMGFEICNHTFTHTNITLLSNVALEENIMDCQDVITNITSKIYPYFRPPAGQYDERSLQVVARNGYKMILWSNSLLDTTWGITPEKQINYVLSNLKNGDIILSHFGAYNTYNVMKVIIPEILKRGYKIVTLSEVLEGLE